MGDIILKRVNENFYKILKKENGKNEELTLESPIINLPFGIEKYKSKEILNLEIDDNDFLKLLEELEKIFNKLCIEELNLENDKMVSCVHKKKNYKSLLRINIKKSKHFILTECFEGEKNVPIYNIEINNKARIIFNIGGIWVHENNYGLYLSAKKIFLMKNI